MHDAAATIDYILKTTGLEKVSLLGHSMGTTIELVLLSMKPAYNEKVNVVLSFAPVAIFTHVLPGLVSTLGIRYGKQLQVIIINNYKKRRKKKKQFLYDEKA